MSDVTVTILPPGRAYGCDDLQKWARRRNAGAFGTLNAKQEKAEKRKLKRWKARRERTRGAA